MNEAMRTENYTVTQDETIVLPCLYCGKFWTFNIKSYEARNVFNVYCPDADCEDRHAASL